MNIMIPPLGTVIELEKDWTFRLYDDLRNESLQKAAALYPPFKNREGMSRSWRGLSFAERAAEIDKTDWVYQKPDDFGPNNDANYWVGIWDHEFTFRAGTRLKIDRYFIRQGNKTMDSVTFRSDCWMSKLGDPLFGRKYVNGRKVNSLRFLAKLDDVNRIEGKFVVS